MTQVAIQFVTHEGDAPIYHASVGGVQAQLKMDGDFEWRQIEVGNARTVDSRWTLDEHGFDAATLRRSTAIAPPDDRPELDPVNARTALSRLIVLPCYPGMPISALAREADVLKRTVEIRDAQPEASAGEAAADAVA